MNAAALPQIIGNTCVGLAALVFLLPLQRLLLDYAGRHVNDDHWVTPALFILIPLWVLLLGALLCVTATGGFDWLRLGRPALYPLTVAASLALAVVKFVFLALYIRPGFTPRFLYCPVIYLVPLATGLVVVLSLNPKVATGIPIQWLRLPWTILAALSLVACIGFFGPRLVRASFCGVANLAHRVGNARDRSPEYLAKIPTLDPRSDPGFTELLALADVYHDRATREAATARLRSVPDFATRLAAALESGSNSDALEFIEAATLLPDEQAKLALPTRTALERFIEQIPAPNYMSSDRRKQLLKWGRKTFPVILGKFSSTDVDFSKIMPAFEHALRPDDTRR
jgi:hypothetical protein